MWERRVWPPSFEGSILLWHAQYHGVVHVGATRRGDKASLSSSSLQFSTRTNDSKIARCLSVRIARIAVNAMGHGDPDLPGQSIDFALAEDLPCKLNDLCFHIVTSKQSGRIEALHSTRYRTRARSGTVLNIPDRFQNGGIELG